MGIAFAENLFTLFLFYEVLTLSTFPLVAHKGDAATVRSGEDLSWHFADHVDRPAAARHHLDLHGGRRRA